MPKNIDRLKLSTLDQLVKRLEQEVEMWCERSKSWPKLEGGGDLGCLRRVGTVEEAFEEEKGRQGQVEMVLDLREGDSGGDEGKEEKVVDWRKVVKGKGEAWEKEIPVYRFGRLLRQVVSTPATRSIPATSIREDGLSLAVEGAAPRAGEEEVRNDRVAAIMSRLDDTIALFERRSAREAKRSIETPSATLRTTAGRTSLEEKSREKGEVYVFYSPTSSSRKRPLSQDGSDTAGATKENDRDLETINRMKRDFVDLWTSCWRIGLWKGEGWEE